MDVLTICCYAWGQKYPELYIRRLAAGVKRNLKQPYQFVCVTDTKRAKIDGVRYVQMPEKDVYLTKINGCFARLRLFDPTFQSEIGAYDEVGAWDRIVNIDLDAVVTGPLDELFDRPEPFYILQGINTTNPCPYNGSLWMLRGAYRTDVWSGFSLTKAAHMPVHAFPDDQGWFDLMLPNAGAYGPHCGVYGFKKKGWPSGDGLPPGARLVAFPGWRDPIKFEHLAWVKEHWKE